MIFFLFKDKGCFFSLYKNRTVQGKFDSAKKIEYTLIKMGTQEEISEPISEKFLKKHCKELLKIKIYRYSDDNGFLKRSTIPCLIEYRKLALENPFILPRLENNYNDSLTRSFKLDLISPRMLFPLANINGKITVGNPDILAERVNLNRANENVTKEEIKTLYEQFIGYIDWLMRDNEEWIKLRGDEFKPVEPKSESGLTELKD